MSCGVTASHHVTSYLKLRWSSTNLADIFFIADRQTKVIVKLCDLLCNRLSMLIILISPNPSHSL